MLLVYRNFILRIAIYLTLAIIFGPCLLNFFTSFGELTAVEERGRVAGFIGFFYLPFSLLIFALIRNKDILILTAFIFPIITLLIDLFFKKTEIWLYKNEFVPANYARKNFIFFLIPWIVFSLINATTAKTVSFFALKYSSPLSWYLQIAVGALGAIIGGLTSDFMGRKLPIAIALTLYGVSSALSAFIEISIIVNFMLICSGLTWGILSTLYLFVIWGDIASKETYPRTYSIGLSTFFAVGCIGSLLTPELYKISFSMAAFINCLLIFVSNIFLILAPEVLPSDMREKAYYKLYIYLVKRRKS
ncbi:MAG: hypothetical protein ACTSYB_17960 [Candidatus Helarchaeota archaeon]